MSKDLLTLLEYLLDNVDSNWHDRPYIKEAYDRLQEQVEQLEVKSKAFSPPTVEQIAVELAAQKVKDPMDQANKFYNFYESKGWMIGKNKMKNWKAAIKTWKFEKETDNPRRIVV
jgi:hypothetical protein